MRLAHFGKGFVDECLGESRGRKGTEKCGGDFAVLCTSRWSGCLVQREETASEEEA